MKNKLIKYLTLSIVIISCLSFTACGEDETVEVVAPIESEETVEPVETVTEEIESVIEESTETVEEVESIEETKTSDADDIVESDIEALDKIMYAKGSVNTRSGPSTDYQKVGGLSTNQEVKVTGQSKSTGWYEIEINGEKQFVSNKYLSDTKVEVTQPSPSTNTGNNNGNTNDDGGSSPTGVGTTTPSGHKVGRENMPRRDLGGSEGGSGEGNNVIWQ